MNVGEGEVVVKKENRKEAEIVPEPYKAQWQKCNRNTFKLIVW